MLQLYVLLTPFLHVVIMISLPPLSFFSYLLCVLTTRPLYSPLSQLPNGVSLDRYHVQLRIPHAYACSVGGEGRLEGVGVSPASVVSPSRSGDLPLV